MMTTRYANINEDDLKYSGPEVWPKITAWEPVDRYIHRRPELAYCAAMRILKKELGVSREVIHIRIIAIVKTHKTLIGTFTHFYDENENEIEDIKRFLLELQNYLSRIMPTRPDLNVQCQLLFYYNNNYLTNFKEYWI